MTKKRNTLLPAVNTACKTRIYLPTGKLKWKRSNNLACLKTTIAFRFDAFSRFSLWCNWIMLSDCCPMTPHRKIIEGTIRRDSGDRGCSALCCRKGLSIPISIAKGDKLTVEAFPPLHAMINNSPACPYERMMNGRNENECFESFCLPSNPSSLQLECLAISQTPSPLDATGMFACVVVAARKRRLEDDNSMLKHF